jgi:glycosyltransferase involved in cell wall biosynthesis
MENVRAGESRLLYLFSHDSLIELKRVKEGSVPTHRLWGVIELEALGWNVELSPEPPSWWKIFGATGWRVWQTAWLLRRAKSATGIVAVHEISAAFFLFLSTLGWGMPPVVVLNLGLLHPKNCAGFKRWVWSWLLSKADAIVSLVEAHSADLARLFQVDPRRTKFLPMAVDSEFLGRAAEKAEKNFVLAVGTNDGKDFETLVEALPLGVRLVVVTDSFNARKVRNHPCFGGSIEVLQNVPAKQLRELYMEAAVVVIPLADTTHGSGHTVLLETMSMGKIVIVSGARCMKDYVRAGGANLLVPVGDAKAMRSALEETLQYPERFTKMRERSADQVRSSFEIRQFGSGLDGILRELAARRISNQRGDAGAVGGQKKEGKKSYASVS